jgi:hypothetical protein
VRETLTIWPPLPIILQEHDHSACNGDNIIAALEHHDRVCHIQLAQFISRRQRDEVYHEARVIFSDSRVIVSLPEPFAFGLKLEISCRQSDWQLSALAQVCSSSIPQPFIPTVERLYIFENGSSQPRWQDDIENSQWLELLHPFTAVKNLYLSQKLTPRIAPALQELVGERINEMSPALQSISLEGLHLSGVVRFWESQKQSGSSLLRDVFPATLYSRDCLDKARRVIEG